MKTRLSRRRFIGTAAAAFAGAPYIARGASGSRAGFEIGLVADAQYADIPERGTRFYREGVNRLGAAVEHFNRRSVRFCVHLGDLIDREWASFDEIMRPLEKSRSRWHQLLGNHDFDVLDEHKPRVPQRLGMASRFGAFDNEDFRFLILDTNDVSTYAHPSGSPERAAAEVELARVEAAKLPQAKSWNGGLGRRQLEWFDRTCAAAAVDRKKVIVLAHHPVAPGNEHNLWNADEVLAIVERRRNVVAWLNGHNHAGNFAEMNGVPFVTMKGMVETADTTAFATARVLPDRILIEGHGREPSRELVFRA